MDRTPWMFRDRVDAGEQLAAALPRFEPANTVVLALPRGGVPVAAEICEAQHLPLDLILVRKIGTPGQPELALGAVSDGASTRIVVNDEVARLHRLSRGEVHAMARDLLPEIERRRSVYLSGRAPLPVSGKTVIVVDDGVATGATLRAALTSLQARGPGRVVVALPVGPSDLSARLDGVADSVVCLGDLNRFGAVGGAYRAFPQVDDTTVRSLVDQFAPHSAG